MKKIVKASFLATFGVLAFLPAARATATFTLNVDSCSGTCGTPPFATVTLDQTTATLVTVTETLAANERFAGTGAGSSLEFDVSSAVGAITVGSITSGFSNNGPDSASAFGSFPDSVTCNDPASCHGGQAGNTAGPLSFTVTSTTGVTIADFIANTSGYYFASDIVGNNGKTGNVGDSDPGVIGVIPEPASLSLVGACLIGLGILRRRFSV